MTVKKTHIFALTVTTALVLAACGKKEETPAAGVSAADVQVVKLGFSAPLTGPQAHYGKGYQNGVTLAIEDENALNPEIGGKKVKFELLAEDDQADPKAGAQVAQKLVDSGVIGVIGHFNSGTSIPASKVYSDAGIPQIAMATAPAYTRQGFKTTFRSMTNDTQQGSVLGKYVVEKLGAKKIAIIDDRSAYGQGLADEFEKAAKTAGAKITKREFTNDRATDFSSILTAIKGTPPDVIFYGGADSQSGPMAIQLKRLGLKAPLVSGEMTRTDSFLQLAGTAAEGSIASLAGLPMEKMPGGKDFETRYKAKYQEMEIYTPYGYDSTRQMIAAMKKANSVDPKVYLPVLAKESYAGVTSSAIAFDEKGDLKDGGITVYKVVGGKWTVLETLGGQ
ncbi:branched-chain amino acid ABC transporter substrate-binding protein [Chitinimonas sp. BJB300]|uniref:branched-chain amino acid ABC transporter substrate-binding protein n=1 Tax=Chitinimonas sp. BJB300 TaxID=1559339 RepID=UPI000C115DA1|nr:branched-chain amino acid ABC transporter substrate-binding protein [Chitinimonas sp. BJB300]PHV10510.1 branched chain amino acid ABC transporter substrate-binding protein [Chitinimonas sp. BJB300]TSJ90757.1 branched-chain amino acid ABC transporter substrate-binding protein [Chitinimonas sp. BJB300]